MTKPCPFCGNSTGLCSCKPLPEYTREQNENAYCWKKIGELEKEIDEQCRINGMGAQGEAALLSKNETLEKLLAQEKHQHTQAGIQFTEENGKLQKEIDRLRTSLNNIIWHVNVGIEREGSSECKHRIYEIAKQALNPKGTL